MEAEANMGRTPDAPPTEDADKISATNSKVESAMNHMRRRAVLRDPNFSEEAFNAFNSGKRTSELLKVYLLEPRTST